MQHPSPRQLQIGSILLSLLPLYYLSYTVRLSRHATFLNASETQAQLDEDIAQFVETALTVQVDDPFNISAISDFCAQQQWRPHIITTLDDAVGGLGNVRSDVLDFVYFTISTGSSIIVPPFQSRAKDDLSSLWNGKIDFANFFDPDNFIAILNEACPQMRVFRTEEEAGGQGIKNPHRFQPPSLRSDLDPKLTREAGLNAFENFLQEQGITEEDDTIVMLGRTLWDSIDTFTNPPLRRSIGRLVQLHPDIRRLAETTANLAVRFGLDLDPNDRIHRNAFMGAHLRTEQDAQDAHWLENPHADFEGQTDAYLAQAVVNGLDIIYTASGNETDLQRFADKAKEQYNITVVWKHQLLEGEDLEELKIFTWDQQALVDYEVMMKCSSFGGFVRSSFSWNIAMRRHEVVGQWARGKREDPYWMRRLKEGDVYGMESVAFDDGLSRVWGRDGWSEHKIGRGMWP